MANYLVQPNTGERTLIPTAEPLVVGRGGAQPVDVQVDDDRVSRVHLSVRDVDGFVIVTDLDSSNGTIVNGAAIRGAVSVEAGTVIELGGTVLRIVGAQAADAPAATDQPISGTDLESRLANPVFQALVDEAVHATKASSGWLLEAEGRHLTVVAVASGGAAHVGQSVTLDGVRGLALAMGQASAQQPTPGDITNQGAGAAHGVPRTVLACPCGGEDAVGVLEVAGKQGDGPFTFEDIEIVSSMATIAGAAITHFDGAASPVRAPAQLGSELGALAESDPERYREVVRVLDLLVGRR